MNPNTPSQEDPLLHRITRTALGAVLVAGLLAAPANAASSRVQTKLRAAERALDRAADYAAEGNSAAAASQLAAIRRNVAAAQKTAVRKPSTAYLAAVASVQGDVVSGTVAMYDGLTGDTVDAVSGTLKAALDGRDAVVAASSAYPGVLDLVNRDASGEAEDIADTLADDELTDAAKSALNAAATQVAAAASATTSPDTIDEPGVPVGAGVRQSRGDCPDRAGDDYPDDTAT